MLCLQIFVVWLMVIGAYVVNFICILPIYGHTTFAYSLISLFFILLGFVAYCYYKACTTDPGSPDIKVIEEEKGLMADSVTVDVQNESGQADGLEMRSIQAQNAQKTYDSHCFKCKKDRPPRSHHCSMCNRCILRYDRMIFYLFTNLRQIIARGLEIVLVITTTNIFFSLFFILPC